MKPFYDKLLSDEGNIFHECPVIWSAQRTVIVNGLFESVQRLEKYMIADVPPVIPEEIVEITASAVRMDVKVDWMDETLDRIAAKRKHLNLLKKSKDLEAN